MAHYSFDRLSAQDLTFLAAESPTAPMHVAAIAVMEAAALRGDEGGIDLPRYRSAVECVLHWIPRYRQRLEWTPVEGWPVWVDDLHFDLSYHIRHIALPKPGTRQQLRELVSRIVARPLDRDRPLWEIWLIEGLEDGEQFALLNKVHHCMIDGASGADLSQILLSPSPVIEEREPVPYMPRPEPTRTELFREALRYRAELPRKAVQNAVSWWQEQEGDPAQELRTRVSALGDLLSSSLRPSADTPLNGELGPDRSLDWLTMPLEDVRELRQQLGCTINDIVLATVAGAVRRYLFRRRVDTQGLDFRVSAPVSTRKTEHQGKLGNHVSSWIVQMPIDEADPLVRVAKIQKTTEELKSKQSAVGIETLMAAAEWMTPGLLARGASLAQGPINMIVTNVPGPQFPLYSVGAKMLGMYPAVPLLPGTGLGIALFSYEGKLCWGFQADTRLVPDLPAFVSDVAASFEETRRAVASNYLAKRTAPREESSDSATEAPRVRGLKHAAGTGRKRTTKTKKRNGPQPLPNPATSSG